MCRTYVKRNPGDIIVNGAELVERVNSRLWKIRCNCGEVFVAQPSDSQGRCVKCGYAAKSALQTKHGESPSDGKNATRLYGIWLGVRTRCYNPRNHGFVNYGGRGIVMCQEWDDYERFKLWALANGYTDKLTLDRIDNNGNYCPENCRWVTHREQMRNTRRNHLLTYNGQTKTMADWAECMGIGYHTLKRRINTYGWGIERALTTKIGGRRK